MLISFQFRWKFLPVLVTVVDFFGLCFFLLQKFVDFTLLTVSDSVRGSCGLVCLI